MHQQNGSFAQNVDSEVIPLSTNGVNKKDRNNKVCGERALPTSTNMLIYKMGWPSRLQFLAPFHISCNHDNNKVGNRSYMHSFLKVTIRENTTEQLLFFTRSKVYFPLPATLDDLEANLRRELANLDPDMLTRALGDIQTRARLCLANDGVYFEK